MKPQIVWGFIKSLNWLPCLSSLAVKSSWGGLIITIGFWLSNLAHAAIVQAGSASAANIARFAILGLILAMGLRAMGLADDIVNLAFGLTLGAIAVAVALSFGLGGR